VPPGYWPRWWAGRPEPSGVGRDVDAGLCYTLNTFELTRAINLMPADAGLRAPAGFMASSDAGRSAAGLGRVVRIAHWRALCAVLGLGPLSGLSVAERIADRDDLTARVAEVIRGSTASELDGALLRAGIPSSGFSMRLRSCSRGRGDEVAVGRARGDGWSGSTCGHPSSSMGALSDPPRAGRRGRRRDEILSELGFTVDDVRRLRRDGVLGSVMS